MRGDSQNCGCQTLILSDDTDVFLILLSNPSMYGRGLLHVLNDTVHDLDMAVAALRSIDTCGLSLAAAYCIAGCDFSPSMYGIGHDALWGPVRTLFKYGGSITQPVMSRKQDADFLFCLLYLGRQGKTRFGTKEERRRLVAEEVRRRELSRGDIDAIRRSVFVNENAVGSAAWCLAARNFVADSADTTNELVTHIEHIMLHCSRAEFIVVRYWGRAGERDLSNAGTGVGGDVEGYLDDGSVVLEMKEEIISIMKRIREVVRRCNCKGDCSTKRCSCFKSGEKCIGCGCTEGICKNRATPADVEGTGLEGMGGTELSASDQAGSAPMQDVEESDAVESEDLSEAMLEDRSSISSGQFEENEIEELV